MKMTKTTWHIIGGVGIATIGIGAYLLWESHKQKKQTRPNIATPTGKPVRLAQGGKAATLVTPDWNNPFDMNYTNDVKKYLGNKKLRTLDNAIAEKLVTKIYKAKGRFNDDEATVATIFQKQLHDKTQVAALSRAFYTKYKKDLWQFLVDFLSTGEMKKLVHDPVRRLPKYHLQ